MGKPENIGAAGVSSALQSAQVGAGVENTEASTDLIKAQTDAITPISKTGGLIGSLAEYIKKAGATTANEIQKAVNQYYKDQSGITGKKPSGAKAYPLGTRPGRNLKMSQPNRKANPPKGKYKQKYYLLGTVSN